MSGWQITEEVTTVAPRILCAVYFIYLPVSGKCLYSDELGTYLMPMEYLGEPSGLSAMKKDQPMIPIDPHLALSLNWITVDKMVDEMPYVTDSLKACLKLIKDVKEEEHSNDQEGLSTSS